MNKLIIDVAGDKIFLMIIANNHIYNITHENTKINYEKLTLIIKEFLELNKFELNDIDKIKKESLQIMEFSYKQNRN